MNRRIRLNRREFLSVFGGVTALSMAIPALSSSTTNADKAEDVTSLHVKGLVMVDLGDPNVIRLGFPKAPGHKATLSVVPQAGQTKILSIKGKGSIEAPGIASAGAVNSVPELIRMKEFYGNDVKSHIDRCPGVITISRNAIRSITATELTAARYTFVRADNGEEVTTFRPRQVADAIKIDISSAGIFKLDEGNVSIPLNTARELRVEYTVDKTSAADPFADHFQHYFPYIERPAALDFDVVPRKVGGAVEPQASPHMAHHFMMLDQYIVCSLVAVP
jgi:hypothetical protein